MITTLLYIVFVLAAIVFSIAEGGQSPKGGGFGDALGSAGQQTFGVKASGIHKFTALIAVVFLSSALLIHILNRGASQETSLDGIEAPE